MKGSAYPASTGSAEVLTGLNITEYETPVKSPANANLIFFHTIFEDLPADEYKSAMSAVAQYAMNGTIPELSGSLKVIFALAKDKIDGAPKQARRRGAPAGNKNASKKQKEEPEKQIKSIQNNSPAIVSELNQMPSIAPRQQVQPTGTAVQEASVPPANLNLNNKLINNNIYLNFLNCENESETARRERIKTALKRYGFVLSDKVLTKMLESVPDVMWLIEGYDFPSYLAEFVTTTYKGKGKTRLDLQKLYLSAWNPEKWEIPWETYPNWLSERMEKVLTDQKALLRKTPPTTHCPDCGSSAPMDGLRCQKCGGFYQWDEEKNKMVWMPRVEFDFIEGLNQRLERNNRMKLALQNGQSA